MPLNPSTQKQKQASLCESEYSPVYMVSSRPARATVSHDAKEQMRPSQITGFMTDGQQCGQTEDDLKTSNRITQALKKPEPGEQEESSAHKTVW